MPYADVNDIRMYYEEVGTGIPFVLMHGATSSIDDPVYSWSDLMPLFATKYRAIHVEHRGHGRTNNPLGKLSYTQVARDVCAFIEQLELGPAHIGGVSDGGIVALEIGMTRPELARTLVTVGANYYNDDLVIAANQDIASVEEMNPDWAADLARRHDRNKGEGYWRELVRHLSENLEGNPAYTDEDLQKIPVPTLLASGEDDPYGNLNQMVGMKRNIPVSELLIVNHAPHEIQHSHAWIVGPVVMDFLSRHE